MACGDRPDITKEYMKKSFKAANGFFFSSQAHYSTGRVSASFTSTAMTPSTTHEAGK